MGDQGDRLVRLEDQVGKAREDIATLKVKAGVWGAVSGTVVAVLACLGFPTFRG